MTQPVLTRRQLAQLALAGAAGAILPVPAFAKDKDKTPMPAAPDATSREGAALAQAVPLNVGYALSATQTKEVALALKGYPGPFGKARTYPIPDDVAPAWVSSPPPTAGSNGGRGK